MEIIEKKFPTETHYHIIDDGEITGVLAGQNHIEGDVERARKRAYLIGNAEELLKAAELGLDFIKNTRDDVCGKEEHIEYIEKRIKAAKGED